MGSTHVTIQHKHVTRQVVCTGAAGAGGTLSTDAREASTLHAITSDASNTYLTVV
jgi:hypothetical protein